MEALYQHKVDEEINELIRFSDYAVNLFPVLKTKNAVKKAIKKGLLFIDGEKATTGTHIKKGQIIELLEEKDSSKIYKFELEIIYEDDHLAVINKPSGISVSGNYFKTIQNALAFNLKKSAEDDALTKFLPTHRLDNQTSGLLLIAKTHTSRLEIGRLFEEKKIEKKYAAIVIGKVPKKGKIDIPVDEKQALSLFKTIKSTESEKYSFLTLLELTPVTGRTHQLRIHCLKMGFPILGDKLYYIQEELIPKNKGLFLTCNHLKFYHPIFKNELVLNIDYPKKFKPFI